MGQKRRREDLFGIPKQPVQGAGSSSGTGTPPLSVLPTRLGLSVRAAEAVAAAAAAVVPAASIAGANSRGAHSAGPAGTSTPAPGASGFSLSTAPFQVLCMRKFMRNWFFVQTR